MWSRRPVLAAAIAGALSVAGSGATAQTMLRSDVAAPLATALSLLDHMCERGADAACSGATVLRERQAILMITNAECARGLASACASLAIAGYELEALAGALSRQIGAFQAAQAAPGGLYARAPN